ncbi:MULTISPECIES: hypothetical protein [unclassified Bradyrhizobium]|uniref:hypothetical protein n=1 Tax=unclassified Bradyrhizobium TaxID=2631580 RepID=UPI002FEED050
MHGSAAKGNTTVLPANELKPPSYGQAQREAIASVVDSLTNDLCSRVGALRKQLDEIEQIVLERAANAKGALGDQVMLCVRLNDEITHNQEIVTELKALAQDIRP